MALKPGTFSNFANSMAAAMEQAFQAEWDLHKDLPLGDDTDRRILFAAIAQGMVNYLRDHLDGSLSVDVSVTQLSGNNVASSGSSVNVTQNAGAGNRVRSEGSATTVALSVE